MATKDYGSKRDDYKTPESIYKPILDFVGLKKFTADVCCTEKNIPAIMHYTEEDDGLMLPWGGVCFMNPPFDVCKKWIDKAVKEINLNEYCSGVWAVIPSDRFETKYYHKYILNNKNCVFGFLEGKQGFIIPGQEEEKPKPSQKIMVACFSKSSSYIAERWEEKGLFNTKPFIGGES